MAVDDEIATGGLMGRGGNNRNDSVRLNEACDAEWASPALITEELTGTALVFGLINPPLTPDTDGEGDVTGGLFGTFISSSFSDGLEDSGENVETAPATVAISRSRGESNMKARAFELFPGVLRFKTAGAGD
jgi:hypothetical protein